jgi:hypothetical protein
MCRPPPALGTTMDVELITTIQGAAYERIPPSALWTITVSPDAARIGAPYVRRSPTVGQGDVAVARDRQWPALARPGDLIRGEHPVEGIEASAGIERGQSGRDRRAVGGGAPGNIDRRGRVERHGGTGGEWSVTS